LAPAQVVTIAEALAELNPRARLLLMLRNPLSRLWSDFFYFAHRRERDLPLPPEHEVNATHFHRYVEHGIATIQKCLSALPTATMGTCVWTSRTMVFAAPTRMVMGCYAPFIREYLRNFNREQLEVFTLEEYHVDPQSVLTRAFAHIGAENPTEDEWPTLLSKPSGADGKINQQGARCVAAQRVLCWCLCCGCCSCYF
jgi:N-acetylgalactosamine 4-sulfate 6-O-sulfotransferase